MSEFRQRLIKMLYQICVVAAVDDAGDGEGGAWTECIREDVFLCHEEHGVVHVKEAGHMEEELDGDSIVMYERTDRICL